MLASSTSMDSESENRVLENPCRFITVEIRSSVRKRDGIITNYEFDNLDRVIRKDLPNAEEDVHYSYDLVGNILSVTQAGQAATFTYDAFGRNVSQSDALGTVFSSFDSAGRKTSLTYPGSALVVHYDYDVTGNVLKIRENNATSGVGVLASYDYTPLGLVSRISFGNGSIQDFSYDPVSRLSSLADNLDGLSTANDVTRMFTYNAAGQIASLQRDNDAYAWQGHINVNRQYVSNGLNQYVSAGSANFAYDTRGNLISDGTGTFAYSSENRLISAAGGISLAYDPLGRLKSVGAQADITRFQYDGLNLIAELGASNSILRRYVHAPGIDQPVVWYEGPAVDNSTRRFLITDERGSIVSIADSDGTTINVNSYDEYGIPASANIGRFGYTGQTWLPQLGMWYYKARFYSPTLGRFLQADPIGYGDGMNWYDYAGGDPVNSGDPTGLVAEIVVSGTKPKLSQDGGGGIIRVSTGIGGLSGSGGGKSGPPPKEVKKPAEEQRRSECNAAVADKSTPIASSIAAGASFAANLADMTAHVAVFVPGGQALAGTAKIGSLGAQSVQALANMYIGYKTGNYSALKAQGAGVMVSLGVGRAVGSVANQSLKGTGTFTRGESMTFGDATGTAMGSTMSDAYCGE